MKKWTITTIFIYPYEDINSNNKINKFSKEKAIFKGLKKLNIIMKTDIY